MEIWKEKGELKVEEVMPERVTTMRRGVVTKEQLTAAETLKTPMQLGAEVRSWVER